MAEVLDKAIIKVKDLIEIPNLEIPAYQRPYKWSIKNVIQLLNDISNHNKKPAYRIGTIVFYKEKCHNKDCENKKCNSKNCKIKDSENNSLNIVDGQQRMFTLTLIANALLENSKTKALAKKYSKQQKLTLLKREMTHDITKANLSKNYNEIQREIVKFDEDTIRFFFEKCEVVKIVLSELSEAFQFFDSQNARGKDLDPHELLKAFHLREMENLEEYEIKNIVSKWEKADDKKLLAPMFALNLFRVKSWCKNQRGRYFNKNDNYLFKGINIQTKNTLPFARAYSMNHFYTKEYNQHPHRAIDRTNLDFPFQLDQPVINGEQFFNMVNYYQYIIDDINLAKDIKNILGNKISFIPKDENSNIFKIYKVISTYKKRTRQGDKYVRNLFDNAVFYYVDKFGTEMLEENIIKIFVWAYKLRLIMSAVKLASIDNYTREDIKMFSKIREAISPTEIQEIYLSELKFKKPVNKKEIKEEKLKELKELFEEFKYLKYE